MRLIDADAYQEMAFQRNFDGLMSEEALFNINLLIDKQPTIEAPEQKHCEWVKCSDRLPKDCETVLTYDGYDYTVAVFVDGHFVDGMTHNNAFITHWMPLPDAPTIEVPEQKYGKWLKPGLRF